jgi:ribosomal protein S10
MPARKSQKDTDDFDSPWKDALQLYFRSFHAFFFADIHAGIDWSRGYEALDKEFQQIVRQAKRGKSLADKLFKVWLLDGSECWLLIHVEVQGKHEALFPERMFNYNVAARRLYNQTVVSLAILCDEQSNWRPTTFEYGQWGCRMQLTFRIAKLLEFAQDMDALAKSENPIASVVRAHLLAQRTHKDFKSRSQWKLRVFKELLRSKRSKEDIRQLFRLIDWIMYLPPELEEAFRIEIHQFEEENKMSYVPSYERLAREEGLAEGILESIELDLVEKFGRPGRKYLKQVRELGDVDRLRQFARHLKKAKTLKDVRGFLDESQQSSTRKQP